MQLILLITFILRRTGIQNRVTSDWENQMQLKLLITFELRRTGIQNRFTSDWENQMQLKLLITFKLRRTGIQNRVTYKRPRPQVTAHALPIPFPHSHDTFITSKAAQSGAENMWRKPISRHHAPCADDCAPWCMFRADDVRGILYFYTGNDKRLKKTMEH